MSLNNDFRSAVKVDTVEYANRSAFESDSLFTEFDTNMEIGADLSSVPTVDLMEAFSQSGSGVQDPQNDSATLETEAPQVNQQADISGPKEKAMDMAPSIQLETGKTVEANVNPQDVKQDAMNKAELAQSNLAEMRASHNEAQNEVNGSDDPSSSNDGSVAGSIARDTAVGAGLAAAAETVAPGTGAVVAAATTMASSAQVVAKMVAAGTNEARNGGELSKPVVSSDAGPGVRRNEAAQMDVMAMDSSGPTSQQLWNKMSQGPGFGTPNLDMADLEITHDHLDGITSCPFEETPEAVATMAALNDATMAVDNALHREGVGINAHVGAGMALAKGLPSDGSAGSVLDREDELQQFAAPKTLDASIV